MPTLFIFERSIVTNKQICLHPDTKYYLPIHVFFQSNVVLHELKSIRHFTMVSKRLKTYIMFVVLHVSEIYVKILNISFNIQISTLSHEQCMFSTLPIS